MMREALEVFRAVDDGDLGGEAGEEDGFFHGGVAAADDGDLFPEAKKPSQVAQELTPKPMSACSEGRLSQRAEAPEAMMRVRVRMTSLADRELEGGLPRGRRLVEVGHAELGAEARGLLLHVFDELGTLYALGPAGEVFDESGDGELAAGLVAFEDEGFEVGAAGVDGGGEAGAAGAEDDDIANGSCGRF